MSLSNESASNVNTNPKIDKRGGERRRKEGTYHLQ